jgi:hypothetical protein
MWRRELARLCWTFDLVGCHCDMHVDKSAISVIVPQPSSLFRKY